MLLALLFCAACTEGGATDRPQSKRADGEQTYLRYCFSCHQSGVAGAPRTGDAGAWAERIEKGEEAMLQRVIEGIPPRMPRKGMCLQCSAGELRDVIQYMVSQSQ